MFQFAHSQSELRQKITQAYRANEAQAVQYLLDNHPLSDEDKVKVAEQAKSLIVKVRENRTKSSGVDALMHEFALSTNEGIALMCLAEALLRIPDVETRNKLIRDKLSDGNWKEHLGNSPSFFVNSAAWGLFITGKLTKSLKDEQLSSALTRIIARGGQPMIRQGVNYAMRLLGQQFVTGQTIQEALDNVKTREQMGYRFSFDMLGEAAMTEADAQRYYQDYINAIHAIGEQSKGRGVYDGNGISVKLSAIHPRYSRAQYERVMTELYPRLRELYLLAKQYDIGLNIDAEEANRLELSLDLIEKLIADPELSGFKGIGIVVQAYQKRCPYVIDYLIDVARRHSQKLMIRLVKGAYWDSETKWAQVDGLEGYPVYTRKAYTDCSYLVCAAKLLAAQDVVFPQFATHNAYTLSAIYHMGQGKDFEFQCLHGMGETLYDQVVGEKNLGRRVRVYAPVGTHQTLLAYLVRRLLENGANSSFVNQIVDEKVSVDDLVKCPLDIAASYHGKTHKALPLPPFLYGEQRLNSMGYDLTNEIVLGDLEQAMNKASQQTYTATSGLGFESSRREVHNPANHQDIVGTVIDTPVQDIAEVVKHVEQGYTQWAQQSPEQRAAVLNRLADLMQEHHATLMSLAVREAGKTLNNAIAEVREAIDFCRYYAQEAKRLGADARPQGVLVTISPWNFPLAIFVGQTIAALAVGNGVVAKPAEQTSLIAHYAVSLMYEAGVPSHALQLVLGAGEVGAALTADPRIKGVIFTGSTEVARSINQTLSKRDDQPILIAETGGQNAMIVDSTALAEQVCVDVLNSAFDSAGQRCSALRVLCVQEDVADHMLAMIKGAMDELVVGQPNHLHTDIGPVIDKTAQDNLLQHIEKMRQHAKQTHQIKMNAQVAAQGTFVLPTLFELDNLSQLSKEVFGPVLHVVRYAAQDLDTVIDQINAKGYALTHGIHTRIDSTVNQIAQRIQAGNIYVNRNIVGAVVGVQPFGGHGLSGTGPKAGGPFYLPKLTQLSQWPLPENAVAQPAHCGAFEAVLSQLHLTQETKQAVQQGMQQARDKALIGTELVLTGPTGERNVLYWRAPRGVWLANGQLEDSLVILAMLQVVGINLWVNADHPLAQGALLPFVKVYTGSNWIPENISHVLHLQPLSVERQQDLANQDGPLTHVVNVANGLDVLRLFEEISMSINTTAAGGNASLMAMSES